MPLIDIKNPVHKRKHKKKKKKIIIQVTQQYIVEILL